MSGIKKIALIFLCIFFGFWRELAFAGGYAIPPQTAKTAAMGGAATAGVDDPSAVYVNPAAITQVDGNQITAGLIYINTTSSARNAGEISRNRHNHDFLPNVFANYHIPNSKVSLGLGSYTPFGLATSYRSDSFTRYAAIRSKLTTVFVTPSIAWEPLPYLSLGAGFNFVYASGLLSRAIFFGPFGDGRLRITDTDTAYGYNLGVLVKPTETVKLGLTYRSRVDVNFDSANVRFTDAAAAGGVVTHTKATALNIPLPTIINAGIHWSVNPDWALEFEYNFARWSEFQRLRASFATPLPGLGGAVLIPGFTIPQKWKDASTLRFGTSYKLTQNFELRAGAALEESPIPSRTLGPVIPGADYLSLTGGFGYHWQRFKIDLGYMAVFYKTRRVTNTVLETGGDPNALPFPGLAPEDKYRTFQHLIGLHATYTF